MFLVVCDFGFVEVHGSVLLGDVVCSFDDGVGLVCWLEVWWCVFGFCDLVDDGCVEVCVLCVLGFVFVVYCCEC